MSKFRVGDEVIYQKRSFVVTRVEEYYIIYLLSSNGGMITLSKTALDYVKKTGRHYPQMEEILHSLEDAE